MEKLTQIALLAVFLGGTLLTASTAVFADNVITADYVAAADEEKKGGKEEEEPECD